VKGGNGFIKKVLLEDDGKTPAGRRVLESENKGSDVKPNPKSGRESTEKFPLVEFWMLLGREATLVARTEFKVEDNDGTVAARRVQVSPTFG
jgi:Tfp pilus assembly protein PilP